MVISKARYINGRIWQASESAARVIRVGEGGERVVVVSGAQ